MMVVLCVWGEGWIVAPFGTSNMHSFALTIVKTNAPPYRTLGDCGRVTWVRGWLARVKEGKVIARMGWSTDFMF
jgi:hypothetical protein